MTTVRNGQATGLGRRGQVEHLILRNWRSSVFAHWSATQPATPEQISRTSAVDPIEAGNGKNFGCAEQGLVGDPRIDVPRRHASNGGTCSWRRAYCARLGCGKSLILRRGKSHQSYE